MGVPRSLLTASNYLDLVNQETSQWGMKMLFFVTLVCLLRASACSAADADPIKVPILKMGKMYYTNATLTKISVTHADLSHSQGMAMIKMSDLPPEIQKQLGYDAKAAAAAVAANKSSGPADLPSAGSVAWMPDSIAAYQLAKKNNQVVVVFYDGGEGHKDSEKLSKAFTDRKFLEFAGTNKLVLLKYDPRLPTSEPLMPGTYQIFDRQGKLRGIYGPGSKPGVTDVIGAVNDIVHPAPTPQSKPARTATKKK
jgi:hypothetical protein